MNKEIDALVKKYSSTTKEISDDEIVERVIYLMINEAWRCLSEKVADNADTVDLAMIMGTGFPPFRGGLMQYAEKVGKDKIVERLKYYETQYGERFKPAAMSLANTQA